MGSGGCLIMSYVNVIRFGIPSVDELFGPPHEPLDKSDAVQEGFTGHGLIGIHLPPGKTSSKNSVASPSNSFGSLSPSSVSICITGPGGTGKSILGMHLASRYLADCRDAGELSAKVLYVST